MCTILILSRPTSSTPLILGANRDEFYDRPTAAPSMVSQSPPIFAGRDLRAGGTWFGVRPDGFLVALTNQPESNRRLSGRISRGTLVTELLTLADTESARRFLSRLTLNPYNHFNLLAGYPDDIFVAYGRDGVALDTVPTGFSVLGNGRLNSPSLAKVARARDLFCRRGPSTDPSLVIQSILADRFFSNDDQVKHSFRPPALDSICVKTPLYGTRSSVRVTFGRRAIEAYYYADGPPDEVPFVDLTRKIRPAQP